MTEDEAMQLAAEAADGAIEDKMIAPIYQMLVEFERQGKTLAEFQAAWWTWSARWTTRACARCWTAP